MTISFTFKKALAISAAAITLAGVSSTAQASTCIGACGTLGANGVVTAPPSGATYEYVTTNGGVAGAGQISGVGGTRGSEFITDTFTAAVADPLKFYFNYVTSDGSTFADYGFAELQTGAGASVGYLFTARTRPSGDTSPGFGLPANISTLNPATSAIIAGGPAWSPLGGNSGQCFNAGCGYTGWIESTYAFTTAGPYRIRFGATNFSDTNFQSGLAFAGVTVNGTPVDPGAVPEPATWAMMLGGVGLVGGSLRTRRRKTMVSFG